MGGLGAVWERLVERLQSSPEISFWVFVAVLANWILSSYRGKYPKLCTTFAVHWETFKRFVGLLTSPVRRLSLGCKWQESSSLSERLPDFYVVGCPKCGITTIYHYLTLHPRIVEPAYKVSRFILGRIGLHLSSWRFRSLFPTLGCKHLHRLRG